VRPGKPLITSRAARTDDERVGTDDGDPFAASPFGSIATSVKSDHDGSALARAERNGHETELRWRASGMFFDELDDPRMPRKRCSRCRGLLRGLVDACGRGRDSVGSGVGSRARTSIVPGTSGENDENRYGYPTECSLHATILSNRRKFVEPRLTA